MSEAVTFSEVWYKDCFYHALFSAIMTLGENHETMQVYDFYKYSLSPNGVLSYKQCKELRVEEGLARIGVEISTCKPKEQISRSLKNWLDEGCLIIVNVDRNVLEPQVNNIDVACHSVLVYGYDENDFLIMENRYVNSNLFEKKVIDADLLSKAYLSFIDILKHFKYGAYVISKRCAIENTPDLRQLMFDCISSNYEERKKSIESLQQYVEVINQRIRTESALNEYGNEIMKCMNDVIVNKNVEEYSIRSVLGTQPFSNTLGTIIEKWKLCRTLIYKYQLLNRFSISDMEKVTKILHEIIIEENKFVLELEAYLCNRK